MRAHPASPTRARIPRALTLCIAMAACAPALAAAPMPTLSAEECAVWKREMSFAQSVAEHDAAAFAQHVDEHAAFSSGQPQPQRGRAFIAQEWAELIAGSKLRLEWYPTRVTIAGRPDVAWSSGPALFESLEPGAKQRYHLGGFRSVWSRGEDGVWRVLFDDGILPVPANEEQVAAFRAGRRDCTSLTSS